MVEFPISGVETYWWLPGLVAFLIASVTSTGGVTGAFILLPFQISVLGYTSPGASPTNLLYNIIAVPTGVYRYHRERRMVWSLAITTAIGTLPGIVIGAVIRLKYLPDPRSFKLFAGAVLLYLGVRLVFDLAAKRQAPKNSTPSNRFDITPLEFNIRQIAYEFNGQLCRAPTLTIALLSFVVGVVGGTYGIGGGAILAPILVTVYRLPVHSVAGAALLGTFLTSVLGVLIYIVISPLIVPGGEVVTPDWWLGLSFGLGGAGGTYLGARLQKYAPPSLIKGVLVAALLIIAGKYIGGYFF